MKPTRVLARLHGTGEWTDCGNVTHKQAAGMVSLLNEVTDYRLVETRFADRETIFRHHVYFESGYDVTPMRCEDEPS